MKKRLFLLLCVLVLSGCGKETTEEEIFTKTIHDFGDLRVDNLDEQEHTNFIVYAEGVQEITTGTEFEWDTSSIVIDPRELPKAENSMIPIYEVLTNEPIGQRLAEYLSYLFPYIDMLWENVWDEDLVPIYPGDAA